MASQLGYDTASSLRWLAFAEARAEAERITSGQGTAAARLREHVVKLLAVGVPGEVLFGDKARATAAHARDLSTVVETTVAIAKSEVSKAFKNKAEGDGNDNENGAHPKLLHMAKALGQYWGFVCRGAEHAARRALCFGLRDCLQLYRSTSPWRGANLGGWLLLEPGPASPFFESCQNRIGSLRKDVAAAAFPGDEHSLCAALVEAGGPELREELFARHRADHYDEHTFDAVVAAGLNAVRLPFGHWVVNGPRDGEMYAGPCIEVLDRAVALADARGLQVVLDLHGNPGGESGDRPCGRMDSHWDWSHWKRNETKLILRTVAARYKHAECVTGLQVCNEPSESIPLDVLCTFYEEAISDIRAAGMTPDRVAVVLPAFPYLRVGSIVDYWHRRGNFLKFDNVTFDLHYYHCFSRVWSWLSHAQHISVVADHARELALLPGAVVGEWSLARPGNWSEAEDAEFASHQVLGYNHATHGWFFWNWHDHEGLVSWDMQRGVLGTGRLPSPLPSRLVEGLLFADWENGDEEAPAKPAWALWPRILGMGKKIKPFVAP